MACKKSDSNPVAAMHTFHLVPRSASLPYGHTWGDWSNLWWEWCTNMPKSAHPLYDTAPLDKDQTGSVWFLGGLRGATADTIGPNPQKTSSGIIPAGTALFFPIYNEYADTIGGYPTLDSLLYWANMVWGTTTASAAIDGSSIENIPLYHVPATTTITFAVPDSNVYGVPAFTDVLASSGDYLLIDSLSAGGHNFHFHTEIGTSGFDVTYKLTTR
jgi:hypothetical protein